MSSKIIVLKETVKNMQTILAIELGQFLKYWPEEYGSVLNSESITIEEMKRNSGNA